MLNDSDSSSEFDFYLGIQKRVLQHIQTAKTEAKVWEIIYKSYANALKSEPVVLTRIEQKRLFTAVLQSLWGEMAKRVSDDLNDPL